MFYDLGPTLMKYLGLSFEFMTISVTLISCKVKGVVFKSEDRLIRCNQSTQFINGVSFRNKFYSKLVDIQATQSANHQYIMQFLKVVLCFA